MPEKVDVAAVLTRHGVPPDADAPTLLAELAARGWEAHVEEPPAGGGRRLGWGRRARVLAVRRRPDPMALPDRAYPAHEHLQATGVTAEAALARVLAAMLAREG